MGKTSFIIGTRGSKLALYQANKVKDILSNQFPDLQFSIKIIKTKGDKILDVALSKIGDKGLFTKEIENELIDGSIDFAVHSLKDLPTELPTGLQLGAVLERFDARDVLISKNKTPLKDLQKNATVATSSLRRIAQLLAYNPSFNVVDIRGNVETRLRKMNEGYCDALIMAGAGINRLGYGEVISETLSPEVMVPAVSQGIIAIESREGDSVTNELLSKINDNNTYEIALAERSFMHALEGGCQVPVGCYSELTNNEITFTGFIANINGKGAIKHVVSGDFKEIKSIAYKTGQYILNAGGKEILDNIRKLN